MTAKPAAKPLRLLSSVPNKVYDRLVVRYPFQTDRDYAAAFHFSAKRLAETFTGNPEDDFLLLPFLTLYRQAFELELKNTIKALIKTRMIYVDGKTAELEAAIKKDRFKEDFGHNLYKLLNEAKKHYAALVVPQEFPKDVEKLIIMMHEADKAGTAFRYSGQLPNVQELADFPDLAALLDDQFTMLTVVEDYVDGLYSAGPTLKDMADDYY
ncbi:hypothetical protein [uncultured Salinibacterium sp.]|uniref:hypothetical protein n=1 Tax=uncultured Salinibacterium sp. TaxID=459274 RepID=UPI0030DBA2AF